MPKYGRKILGDGEFERQLAMETGGRGQFGSKVVDALPEPSPAPPPPADTSEVPVNVVDILLYLKDHPEGARAVLAAELGRERPRSTVMARLKELGV